MPSTSLNEDSTVPECPRAVLCARRLTTQPAEQQLRHKIVMRRLFNNFARLIVNPVPLSPTMSEGQASIYVLPKDLKTRPNR